jgi:hypothetical protein
MTLDLTGTGRVLTQVNLGSATVNPIDIVEASTSRYYVSVQNGKSLYAGPTGGSFAPVIDLSSLANPGNIDGLPNMDQMVVAGGKVYLLIQRGKPNASGWGLDFDSCGLIAVVNPLRDSVEKTIRLKAANPGSIALSDSQTLYVINQGNPYASGDGDIERIDLTNDSVLVTATETDFGADVQSLSSLTLRDAENFYIMLSYAWTGSSGRAQVWLVNARTGAVLQKLSPLSDAWGGLAYSKPDNLVCVGDRGLGAEGVKLFNSTTGEFVSGPISVGLSPYSMRVLE